MPLARICVVFVWGLYGGCMAFVGVHQPCQLGNRWVLFPRRTNSPEQEKQRQKWAEGYFLLAVVWSIGAVVTDFKDRAIFDRWLRAEIGQPGESSEAVPGARRRRDERPHKFIIVLPERQLLYDVVYSKMEGEFVDWMSTVEDLSTGTLAPTTR